MSTTAALRSFNTVAEEFEQLHADCRSAMVSMKAMLKMSAYDCTAVPVARYRMIRASTQRLRFLTEVAYPYALRRASLGEIEALRILKRQARDNYTRSSAHVNKWNSTAVSANWEDFKQ